jgi:hypothetical protein
MLQSAKNFGRCSVFHLGNRKLLDQGKNAAVVGCELDYFAIKDWPAARGDVFDAANERIAARVAVLGHTVAADLFGTSSPHSTS